MLITQMLKEAREAGESMVVVHDGVFCLHWIDGRGLKNHPHQIWMFVPRD